MKPALILLLFVLAFDAARAATDPIAVAPFRAADERAGEDMAARVLVHLARGGRYTLVERGQLKKALEEIARAQSGAVQAEEALEIGRITGARYLIVGEVAPVSGSGARLSATARVIKTETGVIVGAAAASGTPGELASVLGAQLDDALAVYLALQNKESPYSILLKLDRGKDPTYRVGERVRLSFRVLKHRRAAPSRVYLRLYSIDATGAMRMIYPNKFTPNEWIEIDREYTFPAESDDFEWALVKPTGVESIQAIVTTEPVDFFGTGTRYRSELFPRLNVGDARRPDAYRAIEVRINQDKLKDWSAERVAYTLVD